MDQLAYFLGIFPKLSETFILNELLALEKVEILPQLFAMCFPEEEVSHSGAQRLEKTTTYLPAYVMSWGWKTVFLHIYYFFISPVKYLSTLSFVMRKGCARKLFFSYLPIARLMKKRRIKHVHVHFALEQASLAVLLNLLIDLPFSLTVHAHDLFLKQELMEEKLERANFIVTCTRFNKGYILDKYPQIKPEKVHVVYHGLNLSEIEAVPDQEKSSPPLLLTVARLVEKKGLKYLLEAAALLKGRNRKFNLWVVGQGGLLKTLKKQVKDLQIEDSVEFLGPREHQEVLRLYQQATLFVLPCIESAKGDRDGIPNVLPEAMASKLAIISTGISGIPELVENNHSGLLVAPEQSEALAAAVEELLDDEEKRHTLTETANLSVRELFDCKTAADKLSTLFKDKKLCAAFVA